MRRQLGCGGAPARQQAARAQERQARRRHGRERPPPVVIAGCRRRARNGEQVFVAGAQERAAQGARKRQPMGRRDDGVEHGDQVLRFGRRGERRVLDRGVGDVLAFERAATRRSVSRLRQSTNTSAGRAPPRSIAATRAATVAASRSRRPPRARAAASSACRAKPAAHWLRLARRGDRESAAAAPRSRRPATMRLRSCAAGSRRSTVGCRLPNTVLMAVITPARCDACGRRPGHCPRGLGGRIPLRRRTRAARRRGNGRCSASDRRR